MHLYFLLLLSALIGSFFGQRWDLLIAINGFIWIIFSVFAQGVVERQIQSLFDKEENLNKRRRAVDCDYESSVWLAQILGSVWHVYKDIWSKFLQETISSNIAYYKPSYLEVEVENFDLGDSPVFPQHTRCIDSAGSDIILDMDACLNSKVILSVKASYSNLKLSAKAILTRIRCKLRVILNLSPHYPYVDVLTIAFMDDPEFTLKLEGNINAISFSYIPFLGMITSNAIRSLLRNIIVLPYSASLPFGEWWGGNVSLLNKFDALVVIKHVSIVQYDRIFSEIRKLDTRFTVYLDEYEFPSRSIPENGSNQSVLWSDVFVGIVEDLPTAFLNIELYDRDLFSPSETIVGSAATPMVDILDTTSEAVEYAIKNMKNPIKSNTRRSNTSLRSHKKCSLALLDKLNSFKGSMEFEMHVLRLVLSPNLLPNGASYGIIAILRIQRIQIKNAKGQNHYCVVELNPKLDRNAVKKRTKIIRRSKHPVWIPFQMDFPIIDLCSLSSGAISFSKESCSSRELHPSSGSEAQIQMLRRRSLSSSPRRKAPRASLAMRHKSPDERPKSRDITDPDSIQDKTAHFPDFQRKSDPSFPKQEDSVKERGRLRSQSITVQSDLRRRSVRPNKEESTTQSQGKIASVQSRKSLEREPRSSVHQKIVSKSTRRTSAIASKFLPFQRKIHDQMDAGVEGVNTEDPFSMDYDVQVEVKMQNRLVKDESLAIVRFGLLEALPNEISGKLFTLAAFKHTTYLPFLTKESAQNSTGDIQLQTETNNGAIDNVQGVQESDSHDHSQEFTTNTIERLFPIGDAELRISFTFQAVYTTLHDISQFN